MFHVKHGPDATPTLAPHGTDVATCARAPHTNPARHRFPIVHRSGCLGRTRTLDRGQGAELRAYRTDGVLRSDHSPPPPRVWRSEHCSALRVGVRGRSRESGRIMERLSL
jgi:hypothetical protein